MKWKKNEREREEERMRGGCEGNFNFAEYFDMFVQHKPQ
jgi:hypothetical protein